MNYGKKSVKKKKKALHSASRRWGRRCLLTFTRVLLLFVLAAGIIGVCGVDTRELTRIVRETGVMNACISSTPLSETDARRKETADYRVRNAVRSVTCPEVREYAPADAKYTVALWDFGCKENIVRELVRRGCKVIRVPASYTAEQILSLNPDGLMLTNGPGDPAENVGIIENIKKLAGKLPVFGICLGHQLFALAMGGKTKKMKYGHRGTNQPVKNLETGRVYISSQNHGYEVINESVQSVGKISFVNANDNTCEGVDYDDMNAFTVQFHPEACSGPLDASYLFDRFIANMDKGGKRNA